MIRKPVSVSSKFDKNVPCSFWTLSDFLFKLLPIIEIMKPIIGIKRKMNKVSLALMTSIAIIVKMIVKGSLIMSSNTDRKEYCKSETSPVTLAKMSPLRFSEKKERGKSIVFI